MFRSAQGLLEEVLLGQHLKEGQLDQGVGQLIHVALNDMDGIQHRCYR